MDLGTPRAATSQRTPCGPAGQDTPGAATDRGTGAAGPHREQGAGPRSEQAAGPHHEQQGPTGASRPPAGNTGLIEAPGHLPDEDPGHVVDEDPDHALDANSRHVLDEKSGYVFDNDNVHSHEQHDCLTAAYDPITLDRLAATGLTAGWRCLDVGAGGGSVARWLAERVAPGGEVVATDINPRHLAARSARPGLVVLAHDVVADPLPEAAFDLVVARLVLQHLPQRLAVLQKLVRALKPGGVLQIDELDATYEPPLLTPDASAAELYRTFLRAKADALRAGGGDPHWGRHVPAAMHAAGLVGIDPRPCVGLRRAGSAELRLQLHHTHHLREKLLAAGMTEGQLREVRALLLSPSFCAVSSTLYSVQGRRPEEARTR